MHVTYDRFLRPLFRSVTPCGTRTRYVSGIGSDSATGTSAAPLRQITTALAQAEPGDLIMVDEGTYEHVNAFGLVGADDAWVAVMAKPGTNPRVNVSNSSGDDGIDIQMSSYLAFYGLEVFGNQYSPNTNPSGIGIFRGSHHIRAWANFVHDFPGGGVNCFYVPTNTQYNLPAGGWDVVDVSFNKVFECSKFSPNNTSGISFFGATDITDGGTWDGRYAYRAVGNYVYDCICMVDYAAGGFDFVTDGNGISVDSLNVANVFDPKVGPYTKRGLVEGNIVVGNGGRGLHVYNSINLDNFFNTYVGNLRTVSPSITDGIEADGREGVVHQGNVICPLNTPNTTNSVCTWVDNVILGGTQAVPAGNVDRHTIGTAYFAGHPQEADLITGIPITKFAPAMSDISLAPTGAMGWQALGRGQRPMGSWQAGALERLG